MKRSYLLQVDRLEDRCVPDADPLVQAVPVSEPAPIETAPAPIFVIDPYLIDPNTVAPPVKSINLDQTMPIPDGYWQGSDPQLVPPIGDPLWP